MGWTREVVRKMTTEERREEALYDIRGTADEEYLEEVRSAASRRLAQIENARRTQALLAIAMLPIGTRVVVAPRGMTRRRGTLQEVRGIHAVVQFDDGRWVAAHVRDVSEDPVAILAAANAAKEDAA